jgi:hypothetical protein
MEEKLQGSALLKESEGTTVYSLVRYLDVE